ncbi:MAG TPA: hypothetical protein DCS93_26605 [Microscillaceae bacterium]|nr:hypothetical protein [Microscillaceae bacterium]
MKIIYFALCNVLLFLSVAKIQAQSTTTDFEDQIQGVYLDYKTKELVYLYSLNMMYYLPKANYTNKHVKMMILLDQDSIQRRMNIQFYESDYKCTFKFAQDFQTFICSNPDGTQQLFTRTQSPLNTSFTQFVKLFPLGSAQLFVPKSLKTNKTIPIEMVMKFLINDDQNRFFSFLGKISQKEFRMGLYTAHVQNFGFYFTFHCVRRLALSNDFYTLLFYAKGVCCSGEVGSEYTYLANFTKQGQLIDFVPLGYSTHYMVKRESTSATAKLVGNKVKINETIIYGNPDITKQDSRSIQNTLLYKVLSDGHIQLVKKWSSDIQGNYIGANGENLLDVTRGKFHGYNINVSYREKSAALEPCQIVENYEQVGRVIVKAPGGMQTWTLRFNDNRDEVILTKSDGSSQKFKRAKK